MNWEENELSYVAKLLGVVIRASDNGVGWADSREIAADPNGRRRIFLDKMHREGLVMKVDNMSNGDTYYMPTVKGNELYAKMGVAS